MIGPYKLLQKLGEGGMGTVWVAEQIEPVRRRVALKLIKPGMDSRQVLSRFEAERQALALMDHPNIAKVFDGGLTSHGRPFFAMEYIAAARTLRDLILDRDTELARLPWVGHQARGWEPEPLRWLAVQTVYGAFRAADALEDRTGRPSWVAGAAGALAGR